MYKYISIEGNIGAGKTSLARKVAEEFGAKLILEEFADKTDPRSLYSVRAPVVFVSPSAGKDWHPGPNAATASVPHPNPPPREPDGPHPRP